MLTIGERFTGWCKGIAMAFTTKINGIDRTIDVDGDTPLLWVIRDVLGMTGTKFGSGAAGLCAAPALFTWTEASSDYRLRPD